MAAAARVASLPVLVLVYYAWGVDWLGHRIRLPFLVERLGRRHPARHVGAALQLGVAVGLQAGFFCLLVVLYTPLDAVTEWVSIDPLLLALGVVLGVGEMGLATLLGLFAIMVADAWPRPAGVAARSPATASHWGTTAKGGWMQYYIKAMAILPRPVAVAVVSLYVVFEEGVFRGVLLTAVAPYGAGLAVLVSAAAFMVVQVFHMPGWRTALFPALGALVVGVVHGELFLETGRLTPLAVAHISYFFSAMWSIRKLKVTPRMSSLG